MCQREVGAALSLLDPIDRELVLLRVVEGLCLAEAARRVGVEYERARYRYWGAMEVLKRRLRGWG